MLGRGYETLSGYASDVASHTQGGATPPCGGALALGWHMKPLWGNLPSSAAC